MGRDVDSEVRKDEDADKEIIELRKENAILKSKLEALTSKGQQFDVIVVWDGEENLFVRSLAPVGLRENSQTILDDVWNGRCYGERRPVARLVRVAVQTSAEEMKTNLETTIDKKFDSYNIPDY
eukprot:Selendium_serpulae@DN5998_c0_g2_i2.p1